LNAEQGDESLRNASRNELADALVRARHSTLRMLERLTEPQWQVPYLATINPPRWELGHVGWFQEFWCLRQLPGGGIGASRMADSDAFYDSRVVPHRQRWEFDLPSDRATRAYLEDTLDATLERLARAEDSDEGLYFFRLALFHEYMHEEAFAYTWQTLGYACPDERLRPAPPAAPPGFARVQGGAVAIGAPRGGGFAFDNEQWSTQVEVDPFEIALAPVTNAQYLRFVEEGGYLDARWWDPAAFETLRQQRLTMPRYWRATDGAMTARSFDRWAPLQPLAPVVHVSAQEAQAYCRWAGVRLPEEAEWLLAARMLPDFSWGTHVWEWTASAFAPLPGFEPGPYREYSAPFFGDHLVVRGGSAATPRGMVDPLFRNFYLPDRGDIFVGFRVCKV